MKRSVATMTRGTEQATAGGPVGRTQQRAVDLLSSLALFRHADARRPACADDLADAVRRPGGTPGPGADGSRRGRLLLPGRRAAAGRPGP